MDGWKAINPIWLLRVYSPFVLSSSPSCPASSLQVLHRRQDAACHVITYPAWGGRHNLQRGEAGARDVDR